MTRTLLISLLLLLVVLAVAGWIVRALRWAVTRPLQRSGTPAPARVSLA